MRLLLDTHIILWALDDNPKLPEQAKDSPNKLTGVAFATPVLVYFLRSRVFL